MEKVNFKQMKDGTKEDYEFLTAHEIEHTKHTAKRLLKALVDLDESLSGYQITRLGHSLQSATRAWRDGADIDWVTSALLHDIGDIYAPYNHDEYAAAILKPFVREQCSWVVQTHGDFRCYIMDTILKDSISTSVSVIEAIRILTTMPYFANDGIRRHSIPIMRTCLWNSSVQW